MVPACVLAKTTTTFLGGQGRSLTALFTGAKPGEANDSLGDLVPVVALHRL